MLSEHIQKKHESYACEECNPRFETSSNLKEHVGNVHKIDRKLECNICNFETYCNDELENHVQQTENMSETHSTRNKDSFSCDKCSFETILESNFDDYAKNKHEKVQRDDERNPEPVLCIYWNHGFCPFDLKEIPACAYQDNCRKFQCPLYHFNKSLNIFLGRTLVRGTSRKH